MLLIRTHDPVNIALAIILSIVAFIAVLVVILIRHESNKPKTRSQPPGKSRGLQVFMVLLILSVGFGIIYSGWRAMDQDYFEMEWRSGGSIGLLASYYSENELVFDGRDAHRIGIGLISLGAMVVIWGLMACTEGTETRLLRVLMSLSFACMLVAVAFIFPPWRIKCLPFYCIAVPVPLVILTRSAATVKLWGKVIVNVLFLSIVAAGFMDQHFIGATILCGMIATAATFLHVLVLFPQLRSSLFR